AWLKKLAKEDAAKDRPPSPIAPRVTEVDGDVRRFFPDDRFYGVRFPRFPQAIAPYGSLKSENVVRVRPDGSVEPVEGYDGLKKLFEKKLADVRDEDQTRLALRACLRLAEEFHQDGHYTFTVRDVSVVRRDDRLVASGKAVVTKGGRGEITATVTAGDPGKVEIKANKIRPDVRDR